VDTTDPLLYNICNIDKYGGDKEGSIELKTLNLNQEIIKAKLKGEYPPKKDESGKGILCR